MRGLEKEQFFLILIFPFLIIMVATLLKGDGMNTTSFLYAFIIWGIGLYNHHWKIYKADFAYMLLGVVIAIISICRESSSTYYFGIQFSNLLFAYILFSDRYFDVNRFGEYCLKKQRLFKMISVMFYVLLLFNYSKNGLYYQTAWATEVFKGPFNLPHTLAYILFFMTLLDLYYFTRLNSIIYLSFAGINGLLILLTSVRSILLPLLFVCWYFGLKIYRGNSTIKKQIISITIVIGFIVILGSGVASHVIEKSQYALVAGGDITNSRGKIFLSSIKALFHYEYNAECNLLLGIGMTRLYEYNLKILNSAIQAHNDFINAITCYGIIGIVSYVGCFLKFIKNNKKWEGSVMLTIAGFNGLFAYGEAIPIIILCRLFFEDEYWTRRIKSEKNRCTM